ncbi:2-oxoacid:ferredoxin oxidoreductase subunit beta [Alicyclobacillus cycloheptanicus]|uniref:2-oxoglutarate ferredoxin oxidoreductase subunit beta n=1 Tax=Alicyclobacillus cycloheptanicus TaxID=1457 RepID=A0ABT9XFV4_9BACL|nr:2-oxoacid:ferredoxin oxidoreductase subunit beta [Alicyclobacillus cycloheptanicus]MDQ0189005.1 2-oxoglutarate ferredoxin oxidoreductase subunit beta [Alicyclobacillus cycloheptanicus]WDM01654.1 2-oxoacid:ferredoxin oxidoreductase subunit beta [Alicyclobacillus cycloheptanicus]
MATVKDFRNDIRPNWCPGCGDFSVQASIQRALAAMGKEPHEVAIISGIGCSGRISGYINTYGFHGVHGRSLPTAQGVKLANRNLTVIASGGDGDGFGIGLNHFMHAVRRNMDITYIVMDNQIYGLTKGQHSPTSAHGFKAKTTPEGNIENALVPTQIALAAGIGFLGQGFSSDVNQLVSLIQQGIQYKGFALINVFSPCVTYNKINTYDWYREHVYNLDNVPDYDPTDRAAAMKMVIETHGLCTGLIYKDESRVAYEDQVPGYAANPLVDEDLHLDAKVFEEAIREFA